MNQYLRNNVKTNRNTETQKQLNGAPMNLSRGNYGKNHILQVGRRREETRSSPSTSQRSVTHTRSGPGSGSGHSDPDTKAAVEGGTRWWAPLGLSPPPQHLGRLTLPGRSWDVSGDS